MNTECDISIIIPCYNAIGFVDECLRSLLKSASKHEQIIVVDDGSADGTASHIELHYAEEIASGLILLLTQANAGVSAARNHGLKFAVGRYIGFVDSDDCVSDDYFHVLRRELSESRTDIIEFGLMEWDGSPNAGIDTQRGIYSISRIGHFEREEVELEVFGRGMWYPCSRIYRQSLFLDASFPVGVRFCEDMMTISQVYLASATVKSIPNVLYKYRWNPQGATRQVRPDYVVNLLSFYRSIMKKPGDAITLLKITIQYTLFSCNRQLEHPIPTPFHIRFDMFLDRLRFDLYRHIELRRRFIIWFPGIYTALQRLDRTWRKMRST